MTKKKRNNDAVTNNNTHLNELPSLSLRITRHDTLYEMGSSGYTTTEAREGMEYLLQARKRFKDKKNASGYIPGVG